MHLRSVTNILLAAALALLSAAAAHAAGRFAGTWRATGPDTLHVRVADDGGVELLHPASGRRLSAAALPFGNARGITALLPSAEVVAIGPAGGGMAMSVGSHLFALTPLPAGEFDRVAPAAAATRTATTAGTGTTLGGMRLSAAQGSLGNYRDLYLYDFCSDGSFRYETMTTGSGVASQRTDGGRWTMAAGGQEVVLQWRSGNSRSLVLRRVEANVVQMDARKYLVERSGVCR
jgi:hypothetical protein